MKRRFRCIESSFFCDFFDFGGEKLLFCAVHTHVSWSFLLRRGFAPAGATRGHENRRTSAVAPLTPSRCTLPCFWGDDVESTRGHSLKVRTTQSRARGQGGDFVSFPFSLAESRGSASGGGWGQRPLVLLQYKRSRTFHPASRLGATYEFSIIIICTMRVSSRTNWSTVMLPSM